MDSTQYSNIVISGIQQGQFNFQQGLEMLNNPQQYLNEYWSWNVQDRNRDNDLNEETMAKSKTSKQTTVYTYLLKVAKSKGKTNLTIQEIVSALKGKKVIATAAVGSHNYPLNVKMEIDDLVGGTMSNLSGITNPTTGFGGNTINTQYLAIIENTVESITASINEKEKEIAGLQSDIEEEKLKLTYLEKTGKTEVEDDEYKEYQLAELLSSDLSVDNKKKAITKLFT